MNLVLKEGTSLVKLARQAIEDSFKNKKTEIPESREKRGVFVTLHTFPEKELRGCIGFIEPLFNLNEAVVRAAKASAFSDPRFTPLTTEEFENIIIEVSVLTKPELIEEDYLKNISIGKDGLVVDYKGQGGLLLPQVFREYNSNEEQALQMTCNKAGLDKGKWKEEECKVYKFQVQLFSEEKPNGRVVEG